MPCDFCHDPKPSLMFPARSFIVDEVRGVAEAHGTDLLSSSGWSACDPCAALVVTEKFDALIRRVMRLNPALEGERDNPAMVQVLTDTYAQFRAARTGPPTLIEAP